jgi:hypothetical protein
MDDILGNQREGDKIVSNISGDAVEMVQQRLAMQAFLYMSNYAKAGAARAVKSGCRWQRTSTLSPSAR